MHRGPRRPTHPRTAAWPRRCDVQHRPGQHTAGRQRRRPRRASRSTGCIPGSSCRQHPPVADRQRAHAAEEGLLCLPLDVPRSRAPVAAMRSRRARSAMRASRRARGAPMQKWTPLPKAIWRFGRRVMSKTSESLEVGRVPVRCPEQLDDDLVLAHVVAPRTPQSAATRRNVRWMGLSKRRHSSMAPAMRSPSARTAANCSGWRSSE